MEPMKRARPTARSTTPPMTPTATDARVGSRGARVPNKPSHPAKDLGGPKHGLSLVTMLSLEPRGPDALLPGQVLFELRRDPIATFTRLACTLGDLVPFRFEGQCQLNALVSLYAPLGPRFRASRTPRDSYALPAPGRILYSGGGASILFRPGGSITDHLQALAAGWHRCAALPPAGLVRRRSESAGNRERPRSARDAGMKDNAPGGTGTVRIPTREIRGS